MNEFFSVQDVSVCLGGHQILDHVSFSVDAPGYVIGILGPNGSGKTTLLKAVCGELPHGGHIVLEGLELAGLRAKELAKRVSYIPQQSGISISMSVLDVVLMGFYSKLGLLSQPSADMRRDAYHALKQVGMAELAGRDYLTLSGGEKQLVIFARTLVEGTKLLLFDEPDSSLDLGNKYRMVQRIRELVCGNPVKTALICLHDPVLAITCCDTLMLLKDGHLIRILRPETDSIKDMELAFTEIYGPVNLLEIPNPQAPDHRRLILLPTL